MSKKAKLVPIETRGLQAVQFGTYGIGQQTQSLVVQEQSVSEILMSYSIDGINPMLGHEHITFIFHICENNNIQFFTSRQRDKIYEFLTLIELNGLQYALECLIRGDMSFDINGMEQSKVNFIKTIDIDRNKLFKVEGMYPCRKCGSKNTTAFGNQDRRGDEGMTADVTCNDCNFKFKIKS